MKTEQTLTVMYVLHAFKNGVSYHSLKLCEVEIHTPDSTYINSNMIPFFPATLPNTMPTSILKQLLKLTLKTQNAKDDTMCMMCKCVWCVSVCVACVLSVCSM